jgi:hypothetical protein
MIRGLTAVSKNMGVAKWRFKFLVRPAGTKAMAHESTRSIERH